LCKRLANHAIAKRNLTLQQLHLLGLYLYLLLHLFKFITIIIYRYARIQQLIQCTAAQCKHSTQITYNQ